jgi:uracil-DNA glycosylase
MEWREKLQNKGILSLLQSKWYKLLGTWYKVLRIEFLRPYMRSISDRLNELSKQGKLCPDINDIFKAFKLCSYEDVKLVIIAQDPYYTKGTAHGLAFSSQQDKTPPSLANIFKEIQRSTGTDRFVSNDLSSWAKQGVLLLNTYLSTELGKDRAHRDIGWSHFSEKVLYVLNNHNNPIVFMLWGNEAKALEKYITNKKHLILKTSHPSPLSVYRGFDGCNHFKMANDFIKLNYNTTINFETI